MIFTLFEKELKTKQGSTFKTNYLYVKVEVDGKLVDKYTRSYKFKLTGDAKKELANKTLPISIDVSYDDYYITFDKYYNTKDCKKDANGNKIPLVVIKNYNKIIDIKKEVKPISFEDIK